MLTAQGERVPGMSMTQCFSGEQLLLKTCGVASRFQSGYCWDSLFGLCHLSDEFMTKKKKKEKERKNKVKKERKNERERERNNGNLEVSGPANRVEMK